MMTKIPIRHRIQRPGHPGEWASLRLLNSYRGFVALVLLIAFFLDAPGVDFGRDAPRVFYAFAASYLILALIFSLLLRMRQPGALTQAYLQFYTDIVVLAGVTYASGGVTSGLGILLIIPVAGSGLMLKTREALLYAALAALMLLTSEAVRHLQLGNAATAYPQAALFGAVLFASALLASLFAQRTEQSAELARQRSVDVRRLAELNERIIQQMEAGILVVAGDGTITLANASARHLLQADDELAGDSLGRIAPAIERALAHWRENPGEPPRPVQAGPAEGKLQLQFTSLGEQGTLIALEDAAFIEEQLQQLKLASLGRLSASIAHEIRNPLGAISHSAQLLAESEHLSDADRRLLQIQLDHCRRVNGIVENILQLSRRRGDDLPNLELVNWCADFADQFRAENGVPPERFTVNGEAQALEVRFDSDHLRQIVTNLCENSLRHGHRTDDAPIHLGLHHGSLADGAYLDVKDDGVAIDVERVEEIFEPFFTTSHSGTGLGLFLARELCAANGAQLRYVNADGGNCFRIVLQKAEDHHDA